MITDFKMKQETKEERGGEVGGSGAEGQEKQASSQGQTMGRCCMPTESETRQRVDGRARCDERRRGMETGRGTR